MCIKTDSKYKFLFFIFGIEKAGRSTSMFSCNKMLFYYQIKCKRKQGTNMAMFLYSYLNKLYITQSWLFFNTKVKKKRNIE